MAAPELTVATQALAAGAYRDSGNDRDPVAPSLAMIVNQSAVLGGPGLARIRNQKEARFVAAPGPTSAVVLDVRELAIHDGGTAVQQFPPLRSPHSGVPFPHSQGKVRIPRIPAEPICRAQDCTFEIWIKTRPARLRLERRAVELLYTTPVSWYRFLDSLLLYSRFEVSSGKLEESRTTVGGERRSGSYAGLVPFGHEVASTAHADRS